MKFQHYAAAGLAVLGVLHHLQRERHHLEAQELKAIHHDEHLEKITTVANAHAAQTELHHRQNLDAVVTGFHDRWLEALTQHGSLADTWKPADLPEGVDYRESLDVNRHLCTLALRYRFGFISDDRLRFVADSLMTRPAVREYWSRNGAWRTAETQDHERHQRFHQILASAASAASAANALATAGA